MRLSLLLLFSLVSLAAALPVQQPVFPLDAQRTGQPLICAHRGRLDSSELENSVTVMRNTFKQGVSMVEFDLRESREGTIFLSHDATLDRTTNASGSIASQTANHLARVAQRDPLSGAPKEPLSHFDDLLAWARGNDVALMVDLKDTPPADAVKAIAKKNLIEHAVLLTFDAKTAAAALASSPTVLVSMLVKTRQQIDDAISEAKGHPLALYVSGTSDASVFEYARRSGKVTITDALGELDDRAQSQGPSVYRDFLATHPVDILVTDHALQLIREDLKMDPK